MTTTTTTPKVQQILAALREDGWADVEFAHTGGGCRAIRISLGDYQREDFSEVLITGDDVLCGADYDSDEYLDGHWWIGGYDGSGEPVDGVETHLYDDRQPWTETLAAIVTATNHAAARVTAARSKEN